MRRFTTAGCKNKKRFVHFNFGYFGYFWRYLVGFCGPLVGILCQEDSFICIAQTGIPRLKSSGGLRFVGTYRQAAGSNDAWNSATRTPTKDLSMVDSEQSHM